MLLSAVLALTYARYVWAGEPLQQPSTARTWVESYSLAKALVSKLTLEQKVNLTTGLGWEVGRCEGNIPPIPEVGWDGLCLEDAPLGVRFTDRVTAFPAGINAGFTWDRDIIRRRGEAIGQEFKGKGAHVVLGPMMNLARVAAGGRNWEGLVIGEAAYQTIVGTQKAGAQACAKHFINNEQEHYRKTSPSNVEDRTQHELYAHPFLRSVMAGVASIMCSYNLINGTWGCENDALQNKLLKKELGFQGYIMSDWEATHSTISANRGLDMTMPGDIKFRSGDSYFGANLTAYVQNGTVSEIRLTDMAERIVAAGYLVGQDKNYPDLSFDAFRPLDPINKHIDVQEDHYKIVREMGAASTVMLKNVNQTLPLKKPISIALIGSDAGPSRRGPNGYTDRGGIDGTLAMGWGSGSADFPYLISPLEAFQQRAKADRTSISWWLNDWDTAGAAAAVSNKDVAVVFIASDSREEYITVDGNKADRNNLTAWNNGDNLVKAVAGVNKNTVVVAHSVGPLILEPWIDHPNVTALLWAGLPGQESGNSLLDVVYGDYNPSAKLTYTIAKKPSDYPAQVVYNDSSPQPQISYTEGLLIDYRWFDSKNIAPRYEFGFGLSYTTFQYADLKIPRMNDAISRVPIWWSGGVNANKNGSSTDTWLHEPIFKISFTVKNTGRISGSEVSQLYLSPPASPGEPLNVLRGVPKVQLDPGKSKQVELILSRYDLSIWDVTRQGWVKMKGSVGVWVGGSSTDVKLKGIVF
ncbi:unnamed protein product [Rhizoctonia solani]|uniref:beta-glucosidase n=1 Tax=Rhizoctonia solani TaxID=456999 RepID=A0A8H3GEA5_9AGAM|nr:unnamed protein product [Rhizoctonia solani]